MLLAPANQSASAADRLVLRQLDFLRHLRILPLRLHLDSGSKEPVGIPRWRGVWGAALHALNREAYARVFDPPAPLSPHYLLRPGAVESGAGFQEVDWFLFGAAADAAEVLLRAWDVAGGMGLGKERVPFRLLAWHRLAPSGACEPGEAWTLDRAFWPRDPEEPCRLTARTPLRILRQGKLIGQPTLADLVVAATRRVEAYLLEDLREEWSKLRPVLLEESRQRPNRWSGQPCDLWHYSARQNAEVEMRGVAGTITLPAGVGPLWPVLAAASWLHLGKGTVFGLGQTVVDR